jgi:hypothetical protein
VYKDVVQTCTLGSDINKGLLRLIPKLGNLEFLTSWVCVIFFAKIGPMYCTLIWEPWGVPWGEFGVEPPKIFFGSFLRPFLAVFQHMVFTDGFLIPVKELGLLTNPGQWIRGLDATGSYMYIVL